MPCVTAGDEGFDGTTEGSVAALAGAGAGAVDCGTGLAIGALGAAGVDATGTAADAAPAVGALETVLGEAVFATGATETASLVAEGASVGGCGAGAFTEGAAESIGFVATIGFVCAGAGGDAVAAVETVVAAGVTGTGAVSGCACVVVRPAGAAESAFAS